LIWNYNGRDASFKKISHTISYYFFILIIFRIWYF